MNACFLPLFSVALVSAAFGGEYAEDFHDAPNLSQGWSFGAVNNVKLDCYSGATSPNVDRHTALAGNYTSLKIERKSVSAGSEELEVVSPTADGDVYEYSFFFRRSSQSGRVAMRVYGLPLQSDEWQLLGQVETEKTEGLFVTNRVSANERIRQVKFCLCDVGGTGPTVAIDSLRIVAVGDSPQEDEEDTPAELIRPTDLKLEATARDTITATWQGVPGERGYRVELFKVEDGRKTDAPDFSTLASGIWPDGWTHSAAMGFGWYSSDKLVKVSFSSCWFASPYYPKPITAFDYKFKSNKASDEVGKTQLVVSLSKTSADNDWIELDRRQVSGAMTSVASTVDAREGFRRVKFSVEYNGSDMAYAGEMLLGVRPLSVVCGECTAAVVQVVESSEQIAVFSGLDASAGYYVTVRPTPSDDPALVATSVTNDLSKEYFRQEGAHPVMAKVLVYEERFDSLSNFVSQTKAANMHLDYWQFAMDGNEMATLGMSQTNTTPQRAGCYVCRDHEKIANIDSAMIGTLATGEHECAFGLAWRNTTGRTLPGLTVTFDSVQRSFKSVPASYAFEWMISDVETSITAEGKWQSVEIPQTAPYTVETRIERTEYRQTGICAEIPKKLPAGKTLLVRWRHPRTTSGPMMAIDNVRFAFGQPQGFALIVR